MNYIHNLNKCVIGPLICFFDLKDLCRVEQVSKHLQNQILHFSNYVKLKVTIARPNIGHKLVRKFKNIKLVVNDDDFYCELLAAEDKIPTIYIDYKTYPKYILDKFTNFGIKPLLDNIVSLDLSDCQISLNIFNKPLPNLEILCSGKYCITDEQLAYLPNLNKLIISANSESRFLPYNYSNDSYDPNDSNDSYNPNDIDFITLTKLTKLTSLSVYNNAEICGSTLMQMINLTELNIPNNSCVTDNVIICLTNLTSLDLSENYSVSINSLKYLTNLTKLNLSQNNLITDDALIELSNITSLNLRRNDRITDNGISHFNLTELDLSLNTKITDTVIKNSPNLVSLSLECNNMITVNAFKNTFSLTNINLSHNTNVSYDVLHSLPNLRQLILYGANAETKQYLQQFPHIDII